MSLRSFFKIIFKGEKYRKPIVFLKVLSKNLPLDSDHLKIMVFQFGASFYVSSFRTLSFPVLLFWMCNHYFLIDPAYILELFNLWRGGQLYGYI